jgi:hypothetical protein
MAALGAGGDPVGGDERAVQAEEGQPGGVGAGQDGLEVGGVGGDHVECLVQIAVGGGDAEPGLAGQGAHVQAVAQSAQQEHDLGVHRVGPLGRPGTGTAPMAGDPAGHRLQHRCGHIQAGTMRHSGLPGKRRGFGETIFASRARALLLGPRSRPATMPFGPSKLVRKPQCMVLENDLLPDRLLQGGNLLRGCRVHGSDLLRTRLVP